MHNDFFVWREGEGEDEEEEEEEERENACIMSSGWGGGKRGGGEIDIVEFGD